MSSVLGPKGQPLPHASLELAPELRHRSTELAPGKGEGKGGSALPDLLVADDPPLGLAYKWPARSNLSGSLEHPVEPIHLQGPGNPPAAVLRVAIRAASEPIPTAREMEANVQLGGRAKGDLFFGLWSRSTPYKAVLHQVSAYHEALAGMQRPPQPPNTQATRLADLKQQLGQLRQSVSAYVDSDNTRLTRKDAMRGLLARIDAEAAAMDALVAEIAPPSVSAGDSDHPDTASERSQEQASERWPEGLTLQRGLGYAREGISLRDMTWAHSHGVGPSTLAAALKLNLSDEAIALIGKYPDAGDPATVRDMLDRGYTLEHMDVVGALKLRFKELPSYPFSSGAAEFAALKQQLARAEQLAASRGSVTPDSRTAAFVHLERCRELAIPDDFAFRCGELGLGWTGALALHKANTPLDQVEAGVRAKLDGPGIAFATAEGFDLARVSSMMSLGMSFDQIRAALNPPPDPDTLSAWQSQHPALAPAMQVLLAKANVRVDALAPQDIFDLVARRALPEQIASIAAQPPSEGELAPYLQIGAPPRPSRAEAMLLKASGLPLEAAACYRKHTVEVQGGQLFVIPVLGPTIQSTVQAAQQVGAPIRLGHGAFNQVYTVRYQRVGETRPTERVFKPVQVRRQMASSVLGINRGLPRYEMRNVACSRIDSLLGFGVVPRTDIGVVRQSNNRYEVGILMEKVNGMTGRAEVTRRVDVTDTELGREFAIALQNNGQRAGEKRIRDYCRRHGNPKVEIRNGRFFITRGQVAAEVLENDAEYQRQLVSLQLFDALVGQGDRHDHNWMRVPHPDGKTARIVGIDNDQCLGPHEIDIEDLREGSPVDPDGALRGVGLPPVVDRTQYDAFVSLSPTQLRAATYGLISNAEQDALIFRLGCIQNHLFDLRSKGQVVEPDGWGARTLGALSSTANLPDFSQPVEQSYMGRIANQLNNGRLFKLPPELVV